MHDAQRIGSKLLAEDSRLIFEDLAPQGSEERAQRIVSRFRLSGFTKWPPMRGDNKQEDILHLIATSDRGAERKSELLREQLKDYAADYTSWYPGYLDHLESVLVEPSPPGSAGVRKTDHSPPRDGVTGVRSQKSLANPAYVTRNKKPSPANASKPSGRRAFSTKPSRDKGRKSAKPRPIPSDLPEKAGSNE